MGLPGGISIDVFDIKAAEKKFDEIKSKADMAISFSKDAISKAIGVSEELFNLPGGDFTPIKNIISNIGDPKFREKVTSAVKDMRAAQLSGGGNYESLSQDQKTQVDIESGSINKDAFINNEKAKWMYDVTHTNTRSKGKKPNNTRILNAETSSGEERPNMEYGNATTKVDAKERDENYTFGMTPKKSGIYVNEGTKEDGDTLNMVFNGKQSSFRMGKEGLHISTDQAYNIVIGGCENSQVDGPSAKMVDGSCDLYVTGPIRIFASGDITISSGANITFTAAQNINMQSGSNCTLQASGNFGVISQGESVINSGAKLSLLTSNSLHAKAAGGCCFGGHGAVNMKGGGPMNIEASTVNINGGGAEDPQPKELSWTDMPTATPTMPYVPKI